MQTINEIVAGRVDNFRCVMEHQTTVICVRISLTCGVIGNGTCVRVVRLSVCEHFLLVGRFWWGTSIFKVMSLIVRCLIGVNQGIVVGICRCCWCCWCWVVIIGATTVIYVSDCGVRVMCQIKAAPYLPFHNYRILNCVCILDIGSLLFTLKNVSIFGVGGICNMSFSRNIFLHKWYEWGRWTWSDENKLWATIRQRYDKLINIYVHMYNGNGGI
jgi:hypothetical protein